MAFTLPVFNLTINLWRHGSNPITDPPDSTILGNLANGRRTAIWHAEFEPDPNLGWGQFGVHQLLCPKDTDIRGTNSNTGNDWLEIPAGSGVYYGVRWVQYAALGFANQHLLCWVNQTTPWVDPLP